MSESSRLPRLLALTASFAAAIVAAQVHSLPAAARYADGAPPGFSGGFGEQSCHACHFHADVNTGPGKVAIDGVPAQFAAGQQYSLTITLSRPKMVLGGFQLTARRSDGGAQAGTLAAAPGEEGRLAVETQNNIQYASQRHKGTAPAAPGSARWTVLWTAPSSGGPVVFHVAANAADGDDSAQGDYIHTASVESRPSARAR